MRCNSIREGVEEGWRVGRRSLGVDDDALMGHALRGGEGDFDISGVAWQYRRELAVLKPDQITSGHFRSVQVTSVHFMSRLTVRLNLDYGEAIHNQTSLW